MFKLKTIDKLLVGVVTYAILNITFPNMFTHTRKLVEEANQIEKKTNEYRTLEKRIISNFHEKHDINIRTPVLNIEDLSYREAWGQYIIRTNKINIDDDKELYGINLVNTIEHELGHAYFYQREKELGLNNYSSNRNNSISYLMHNRLEFKKFTEKRYISLINGNEQKISNTLLKISISEGFAEAISSGEFYYGPAPNLRNIPKEDMVRFPYRYGFTRIKPLLDQFGVIKTVDYLLKHPPNITKFEDADNYFFEATSYLNLKKNK